MFHEGTETDNCTKPAPRSWRGLKDVFPLLLSFLLRPAGQLSSTKRRFFALNLSTFSRKMRVRCASVALLVIGGMRKILLALVLFIVPALALAAGNTTNDSFRQVRLMLERQVYHDHRVTIYCGAKFDAGKRVALPEGSVHARSRKTGGQS